MQFLDDQQLFPFLRDDPVFQRTQLARDVSATLLEELRESLYEEVCATAQAEVREILPRLLLDALEVELRDLVRRTFTDELRQSYAEFREPEDPADWWRGDDESG